MGALQLCIWKTFCGIVTYQTYQTLVHQIQIMQVWIFVACILLFQAPTSIFLTFFIKNMVTYVFWICFVLEQRWENSSPPQHFKWPTETFTKIFKSEITSNSTQQTLVVEPTFVSMSRSYGPPLIAAFLKWPPKQINCPLLF